MSDSSLRKSIEPEVAAFKREVRRFGILPPQPKPLHFLVVAGLQWATQNRERKEITTQRSFME